MKSEPELVCVASGLEFPEGPAYDGKGSVYCSNNNADYIVRVDADGRASVAYRANASGAEPFTFQKANGMTFYRDGSLFVCDFGLNAIVRIFPEGRQECVVNSFEGSPLEAPNDLTFDPQGNLWFSAPKGSDKEHPVGPLYRYEPVGGKLTRFAVNMAFPNGLAFDAKAEFLYVAETLEDRIVRFPIRSDGALGAMEVFADLSGDPGGIPDGVAFDVAGNLWVAHYSAHSVVRLDSQGRISRVVKLPYENGNGPTNVEFAGRDLRDLYITDPGSESLYRLSVDIPGLPLFCAPPNIAG